MTKVLYEIQLDREMSICNHYAWLGNILLYRNTLIFTAQPSTMATSSCLFGMKKTRIRSICTSFYGNISLGTDSICNYFVCNLQLFQCWLPLYWISCIYLINSKSDVPISALRTPAKTIYERILVTGLPELPSVPQLAKVMMQSFFFCIHLSELWNHNDFWAFIFITVYSF